MMARLTLGMLLVGTASGLSGCSMGGGDRIPFLVNDKIYIVTADDDRPGDIVVTGTAGSSLTPADGPAADRAFAEFCLTQGHEGGTPGNFVSAGTTGHWHYAECSR